MLNSRRTQSIKCECGDFYTTNGPSIKKIQARERKEKERCYQLKEALRDTSTKSSI